MFRSVYSEGRSVADRYIVVYYLENGLNKNRLGISVSKKTGNSVIRHHLCRLVRESYRLSECEFKAGYDIVVICRVAAAHADYHRIDHSFLKLCHKLGIMKDGDEA